MRSIKCAVGIFFTSKETEEPYTDLLTPSVLNCGRVAFLCALFLWFLLRRRFCSRWAWTARSPVSAMNAIFRPRRAPNPW